MGRTVPVPELIRIFTDESRQTKFRYMIIGGIWLPDAVMADFEDDVYQARKDHGMQGAHMKWTKVSNARLTAYMDFVDVFFKWYNRRQAQFRCILVDTTEYPLDSPINQGDAELGFYKFYYQLLLHGMEPTSNYLVTLASRTDKQRDRLQTLHLVLNRGLRKKYQVDFSPVRHVESKQAENSNGIQLADIIMGAVGYHWHDLHMRPEASVPKKALAAHIAHRLGRRHLKFSTPPSATFNIWRFKSERVATRAQ